MIMNFENMMMLINELKIEYCPKHTCIFKQGEKGVKFYIMLKGQVYCLIQTQPPEQQPTP